MHYPGLTRKKVICVVSKFSPVTSATGEKGIAIGFVESINNLQIYRTERCTDAPRRSRPQRGSIQRDGNEAWYQKTI